jgi:hypothetical protein
MKKFTIVNEELSSEYATETRIERAAEDAQESFWAVIVEHFPEIKTGDFHMSATFEFDAAIYKAIRTWVDSNSIPAN